MKIPFIKMHTLNNHYAYINNINGEYSSVNYKDLAIKICNAYDGLGTDGLVVIEKSNFADLKIRIYSKNGSELDMCVNALFAISLYAFEEELVDTRKMYIETNSQVVFAEINNKNVTLYLNKYSVVNNELISLGNNHMIRYLTEDYIVDENESAQYLSEKYDAHVGFAKVADDCVYLVTYEKETGLSQANGSNACATALMSVHRKYKKMNEVMRIKTLGGEYEVSVQNYYVKIKATPKLVLRGEYNYQK